MFRDERDRTKTATKEEFVGWLEAHKHEEIKRLIVENGAIGQAIDNMLRDQHGQVMSELAELNRITTGLAHRLAGISDLATAVDAAAPQLSDQAVSILRQFNEAQASKAIQLASGMSEYIFGNNKGSIEFEDERFVDDDIETLVSLGLLLLDYNNSGGIVLKITRAGAKIGESSPPAE
jgi:hypothetical protein